MTLRKCALLVTLVAALTIAALAQDVVPKDSANYPLSGNEKGGLNETGPYEVVVDHFKHPFREIKYPFQTGWIWGAIAGIHAESPNRIYVFARGLIPAAKEYFTRTGMPARSATPFLTGRSENGRREHVLTVYDRNGNLVEDWTPLDALHQKGSLARRLRVNPWDPEKHLWLVDAGLHRILKVTRDGKVVQTIGPSRPPPGEKESPSGYFDMAFLLNGDFWALEVTRVVKFSKDGSQLREFGRKGTGPGELIDAHGLAIDARGRIYVGDHGRIQVFDDNGTLLDLWPNIRFGVGWLALDRKNRLWVADSDVNKIAGYDLDGKFLYASGTTGINPGQLYGVSQFDVDSEGNLYTVEHYGGRIQMFRPKKSADPRHLIAQLVQ